jgi:hypothetical protein
VGAASAAIPNAAAKLRIAAEAAPTMPLQHFV